VRTLYFYPFIYPKIINQIINTNDNEIINSIFNILFRNVKYKISGTPIIIIEKMNIPIARNAISP
jgi:CRISPR/Cas system endoribonuclease Cas6 (RAMP superfamily)